MLNRRERFAALDDGANSEVKVKKVHPGPEQ
jgi:hypothetical protein